MDFKYNWIMTQFGVEIKSVCSFSHENLERNEVYCINDDYILKVYGDHKNWERELKSLSFAQTDEFQIPKVLDFGFTSEQRPWLITKRLKGKILSDIEESYSQESIWALYHEIGKSHARFHKSIKVSHFGDWATSSSSYLPYESYIDFEVSKNRRRAEQVLACNYPEHEVFISAYEKLIENESSLGGLIELSLCHNDFSGRNILVSTEHNKLMFTGLVDFELAYPSNIESDILKMLLKTYRNGTSKYYLDGYLSENELVFSIRGRKEYYALAMCLDICSWSREKDRIYFNEAVEIINHVLNGSIDTVFNGIQWQCKESL